MKSATALEEVIAESAEAEQRFCRLSLLEAAVADVCCDAEWAKEQLGVVNQSTLDALNRAKDMREAVRASNSLGIQTSEGDALREGFSHLRTDGYDEAFPRATKGNREEKAETQSYLPLFGLDKERVREEAGTLSDEQQSKLRELTEKKLRAIVEELLTFLQPASHLPVAQSSSLSTSISTSSSLRLVRAVKELQARVASAAEKKDEVLHAQLTQVRQAAEALSEAFSHLTTVIVSHKGGWARELEDSNVDSLFWNAQTLCLKLDSLRSDVWKDVFLEEKSRRARIAVAEALNDKRQEVESELNEAKALRAEYSLVDDTFQELARRYSSLKQRLEEQRWTLKELTQ